MRVPKNNTDVRKIMNLLNYTKEDKQAYSAVNFNAGYHTHQLHKLPNVLPGQRNCSQRLSDVNYNFKNKTVLDIGCNQGGMLFNIQDTIFEGVGLDFNPHLVNAANRIKHSHNYNNLSFYHFDLNNEDFDLINNFSIKTYDITFLLSVCMWIDNWEALCQWVSNNSVDCLFETNGSTEQQDEQYKKMTRLFDDVAVVNEKSLDDPRQQNRRLLLCTSNDRSFELNGVVVSGNNGSPKWMATTDSLNNFFPGTLNIKLNTNVPTINYTDIHNTIYGPAMFKKCTINNIDGYIVLPPSADAPENIIEIAAGVKLREKLTLSDGDNVTIKFNKL